MEEGNPHLTAEPDGPGVQHVSSSTTSATFTGLSANQTYKFRVFAHNGQGCTASPEVEATPRAAPGKVTAIDVTADPVDRGGGVWDFRLDGLTAPGDVDSFIYRLSGGTTEGSEYGPVPFASYLTAGTTHYGNEISVQVKACRQYPPTLCSAEWSDPFSLGTPILLEFTGLDAVETQAPQGADPGLGYWTWTLGPGRRVDRLLAERRARRRRPRHRRSVRGGQRRPARPRLSEPQGDDRRERHDV